jgi:hypothetical protein
MKTRTIYIGKGQFIANLCAFLPANAFINKRYPGGGGTTAELLSKRNSIIIVPNVPVIVGKVKKMMEEYKLEVLGIYYPFNDPNAIVDYLLSDVPFKNIMVTPESYKKLVKAFENPKVAEKFNRHKDFFLLFDESEKIVQDVSYRKSIVEPLNDFFRYAERSMISATPILPSDPRFEEYGFEHVIFQPKFEYSKAIEIAITNNIIYRVRDYLKENVHTHYCFFMNSTDGILSLIKHLKIESESQVLCGEDSAKKLRNKLKFPNATSDLKPLVKYNFFTSRFYSAVDIDLDIKPNVILLTDLFFAGQSIFDPATESIQAIGRFRNGINKAIHITNINPDIEYQSREMALKFIEGGLEAYKTIYTFKESSLANSGARVAYEKALKALPSKKFVIENTDQTDYFSIDNSLDEQMVNSYYASGDILLAKYKELLNFKVNSSSVIYTSSDQDRLKRERAKNDVDLFKAIVEQLEEFNTPKGSFVIDNRIEVTNELNSENPAMVQAYLKHGKTMIVKANYKFSRLNTLVKAREIDARFTDMPVIKDVLTAFNTNQDLPCKIVNAKVVGLKNKYGITGTTAQILIRYFTISARYQKVIKGERQWCIKLTNPKFTLDD